MHDTKLLFQTDETSHLSVLADMFVEAKRFDCLIAFAKTTGFNLLQVKIEECLKNGGEGRLVIGLSLHQTEPKLLSQLYKFTNKYNLELFLSNSEKTFHPKVYAFEKGKGGCTVVMGSANLTAGGLVNNIEASSITSDRSGKLFAKVSNYIGWLIDQKVVKKASPELIQKYAEEYDKLKWKFYDYQHALKVIRLEEWLLKMREDKSEDGFANQISKRKGCISASRHILTELAGKQSMTKKSFVEAYEGLISYFHSDGLHRGKNIIAEEPKLFIAALADLLKQRPSDPAKAYQLLHRHFVHIKKAGVNVITEILHTIDPERFAVMNQNAVSGMGLADIDKFPLHPLKSNVDGECYASFCRHADEVRKALRLNNFSEMDALFNYVYWRV